MCGIAGLWQRDRPIDASVIRRMTDALARRGPDGSGVCVAAGLGVALGHRRLAVIDLSEAAGQPMGTAETGSTITYNGEVYNFRELRAELETLGVDFRTRSDAEVVLRAYERWGPACVERLAGMFAFAVLDRIRRVLFLARDRVGVKPLYFYSTPSLFAFASEPKALFAHPAIRAGADEVALALYLRHGYIPGPRSAFKGIERLPAGTCLELSLTDGSIRIRRYWDLLTRVEDAAEAGCLTSNRYIAVREELESRLTRACRQRLCADVPVGVFLSGGIDSSAVVAALRYRSDQPLQTFTIGFGESEYDESSWARRVAERAATDHHEYIIGPADIEAVISDLAVVWDEPFADSSALVTLLLARRAATQIRVALSADGGDEIFGGYGYYRTCARLADSLGGVPATARRAASFVAAVLPTSALGVIGRAVVGRRLRALADKHRKLVAMLAATHPLEEVHQIYKSYWLSDEAAALMANPVRDDDPVAREWERLRTVPMDVLTKMQIVDFGTSLVDDMLVKVDRATMAAGVEGREPLLDHELIEWYLRLPASLRHGDGRSKGLLRRIASTHLGADLFDRPKQGFIIPLAEWCRGPLAPWLDDYLAESRLRQGGLLDPVPIQKEWTRFKSGAPVNAARLWSIFCLQLWWERWAH